MQGKLPEGREAFASIKCKAEKILLQSVVLSRLMLALQPYRKNTMSRIQGQRMGMSCRWG